MKKVILFLVFSTFIFPKFSLSCTCIGVETFCETIIDRSTGDIRPELILRGEIIESAIQENKRIQINELIFGEINESEIELSYSLCTINFGGLEIGNEYIIALNKSDDLFSMIDCGNSFLKIENEKVVGKIAPGIESIDYSDLPTLEACGIAFDQIPLESCLAIFPNPTIGELKVENTNPDETLVDLQLKIFDSIGRELTTIRKEEGILPEEFWEIDMENFPSGFYIFKFSAVNLEKTAYIVKQ